MEQVSTQTLADEFLGRLQGVKEISHGKYVSLCPSHPDKKPSLTISEKEDRLLIHCWSGCQTADILGAIGLDFQALFVDGKRNSHPRSSKIRQHEPLPFHRWDWRETCGQLEQAIQAARERSVRVLEATIGLDIANLSDTDLGEIWTHLGPAYFWLEKCEELDDMLYIVQHRLRQEEQDHERTLKRKRRKAS